MNKNNCLMCKWEPNWSGWTCGEYKRCSGKCRYPVKHQTLPATYKIFNDTIVRYTDDSGIPSDCRTWEEKE